MPKYDRSDVDDVFHNVAMREVLEEGRIDNSGVYDGVRRGEDPQGERRRRWRWVEERRRIG